MSMKNKTLATLALTGVSVAMSCAYAAGFQLTEQSSLGLGRSYAGAGIVGDDLSAAHYNAAGMTLLPGTQIQAGSVWIAVNAPFNDMSGNEIENGRLKGQAIPTGYITHQLNEKTWLGLAMTVPYGMGTEYAWDWQGSSKGNESMIMTIDINPSIAYKINDALSIGAGISLQYAKAELGVNKSPLANFLVKGDTWAWGWNLGLMFQPCETVRLGLAYRSHIAHNAEGELEINHAAVPTLNKDWDNMKVRVKTPDTLMATATWEATNDLRLSGLIRWAKWSNLEQLNVYSDAPVLPGNMIGLPVDVNLGHLNIQYKWDDTWLFSVGADYRLNNEWTVRGGLAYETGAVSDETLRTATIPDVDRVWFSAGATYHYSDKIQFDFGASYLMGVGNKDLYLGEGAAATQLGEYDRLDAYIVGAQFQYRF